jgi:hypothetical protein
VEVREMAWKDQEKKKKWLSENKERVRDRHLQWIKNNRERYNTWNKEYQQKYRDDNREKLKEESRFRTFYYKLLAMEHYSNGFIECAVCGEDRIECLSLDHIYGGGTKHRKDKKIKMMAEWLRKYNYPTGYRVLCMNCQFMEYRCRQ